MGNTLYLECSSGISGDMAVGALLDLGADPKVLRGVLDSLSVEGFEIEIRRVKKAGLDVCDFRVKLDKDHENHDHDMEYLHGYRGCGHEGGEQHLHEEAHNHLQMPVDGLQMPVDGLQVPVDGPHVHEHRGLSEIRRIIDTSKASTRAKEIAGRIFQILAEAEAKAHGVPVEQVHFHEVGAVDSIADIIALAVCMDDLDITEVIVPELSEGRGFVRCQHGVIPVPVPAVVNIAAAHGISLHYTDTEGELVTPTGAAFVAAVRTSERLPEQFKIRKVGMGAGKRSYDRPSLLRAMLIEAAEQKTDIIYQLETNIDDCSGESLGYVMECLFEAGARDVHYTPVFMKKNRPAYQLTVICSKADVPEMETIIFRETTTIGIRRIAMERTVLKRKIESIQTVLGDAEVKVCTLPDGEIRYYPEYESAARLAKAHGISYQKAFLCIQEEAEKQSGGR